MELPLRPVLSTTRPGVLPCQRATEQFKAEVVERHEHGRSLARIERSHDVSWATHRALDASALRTSRVASGRSRGASGARIDEHFFTRNDGYAATFANLETRRVFDVLPPKMQTPG